LRAPRLRAPNLRAPRLRAPKLRGARLRNPKLRAPRLRNPKLRAPRLRSPKLRAPSLGSLNLRSISLPLPSLRNVQMGRRGGTDIVGLDIQPGFVAAVKVSVNGSIVAQRAVALPLAGDIVRDGEVLDADALGETLRELFAGSGLGKRVRVGVANQRTVLRTLEVPPLTDAKELAAAVTFQAQDQVPMPLGNAVLDFHPLGIVDTPQGARQRVVLVAAQRDMVERLLNAVRGAGLTPVGVDLSAFALIRSLYRPAAEEGSRVMYLNIDGLTNLAIAEGKTCRFTRVVGGGLESIASELAVRRGIALAEARTLLASVDLAAAERAASAAVPAPERLVSPPPEPPVELEPGVAESHDRDFSPLSAEDHEAQESAMSYEELSSLPDAPEPDAVAHGGDREVAEALETGIREIAGEVRNSLDFHRSQEGGGEVSHIVLSGAAQDIPGFADSLSRALGVEIRGEDVATADQARVDVSAHRLAVAAGLATLEAPQ
jgi:type IV pilus assembly protein PilM